MSKIIFKSAGDKPKQFDLPLDVWSALVCGPPGIALGCTAPLNNTIYIDCSHSDFHLGPTAVIHEEETKDFFLNVRTWVGQLNNALDHIKERTVEYWPIQVRSKQMWLDQQELQELIGLLNDFTEWLCPISTDIVLRWHIK